MEKKKGIFVTFLMVIGLQVSGSAAAQVGGGAPMSSSKMGIDYNKSVRPHPEIEPLGSDLFGDSINFYTGATQFSQTDIDLRGNNALPVRLSRRASGAGSPSDVLGDWELDLPYIGGTFSTQDGWITWVPGAASKRCSVPLGTPMLAGPAPSVVKPSSIYNVQWSFDPRFIWHGNTLHVPGEDNQEMLVISPAAPHSSSGEDYRWITPKYWTFSCLASVANGIPGEAFLARSPDGTKYWFNWIVSKPGGMLSASWGGSSGISGTVFEAKLPLSEFRAYPTRIEDHFGNYVVLAYDSTNPWQLKSIKSSDGRLITLDYSNGRINQAKANGRTWKYGYTADLFPQLQTVSLPDGSHWLFNHSEDRSQISAGWLNCADYSFVGTSPLKTVTMTHPSGAVGTFQFRIREHGRTNGPHLCVTVGNARIPVESHFLFTESIYRKQISGPGLVSPATWDFTYSPISASVAGTNLYQRCTSTPCPAERTLTVTREDGNWQRYTYSQDYKGLEGKLLSEQVGNRDGVVIRTETLQYQTAPQGDYAKIGTNPCYTCNKAGEIPVPVVNRVISQDGREFKMHVNSFDSMARPKITTKSSNP